MQCFIDIHSHILPGVDDGARDMYEAMQMLSIAYEQGIRMIIATPHYSTSRKERTAEELKEIAQEVSWLAQQAGMDMQIILGNELMYSMDLVVALDKGEALTIDGTRYILLEFLPSISKQEISYAISQCIYSGYIPILAHAERYRCLRAKPERVGELIRLGAYIQLNLSSLEGGIISSRVHFMRKLLKNKWVHFLGTDSHGVKDRSPLVEKAIRYLRRNYGEEMVRQLLWENPMTMLEDRHL
ncbi:MAG: hypothetical protein GX359_06320 [Clostridiales bacterium]|nr:hypothetical protein [Clostridiales bacterium]